MQDLLSQLLIKLVEKEAEEEVLRTRIASLECLVAAIIAMMDIHQSKALKGKIDLILAQKTWAGKDGMPSDVGMLNHNIQRVVSAGEQK